MALCIHIVHTVWPEILAVIYFGGLLKFFDFGRIYLGGWEASYHNDVHSKMAKPGMSRARLLFLVNED